MRKKLTLLNSLAGVLNKTVSIAFVFLVRHFFTKYLSVEYLGLEGLFANILGLFSLIDLGLGNAISFNLYEPLQNNNHKLVSSIMRLYRKLYVAIGIVVFALSLIAMPFVPGMINGRSIPSNDVQLYFLIYALGVAITYFFAYKRTLIFALQKNYIVLNVDTIIKIVLSITQILVLMKTSNYELYLGIVVIFNFIGNSIISMLLKNTYALDYKSTNPLTSDFKNRLKEHIKALAITNISWQAINSTDNIIISYMVGIVDLAKNANYSTLTVSVNNIVSTVLGGVSASIGDLITEGDNTKIKDYFYRYCFISCIFASYVSLGIYFVTKPFVSLWVGEELLFPNLVVFVLAINTLLITIFNPLGEYQNYSGCFVHYKKYGIIAMLINLTISIVLSRLWGIIGVFLGTTITYLFMIWAVSRILYQYLFKKTSIEFYKKIAVYLMPLFFSYVIISFLLARSNIYGDWIIEIVVKFLIVSFVYFGILFLLLYRNAECRYFRDYIRTIIRSLNEQKKIK